ncbi:MAG: HsdR family type I site-specific deoxyribonuclease, partial [Mycoplasmataceae bacterium]|nr:HsdR family type I site-specific deoxyribonuclease [Mycoplasmataceae bacterium]
MENKEKKELESNLENNLIAKLVNNGYKEVDIHSPSQLKQNFKKQLEILNDVSLTDVEFNEIFLHIDKGSIFRRANNFKNDNWILERENQKDQVIQFFDTKNWAHNTFQVTNQIRIKTEDKIRRYDVTILINGLPIVQIELKQRGVELKQAFNQINNDYKKNSYHGLFHFLQLFIISNGNETKYFCNNIENFGYQFAFNWTDENNKNISDLLHSVNGRDSFVKAFLNHRHLWKMINNYVILQKKDGEEEMKVLRPYQFHAIQKIIDRVNETSGNGYIWHTTGSGKTLTSFKAAQIIKDDVKQIKRVLFVVDRIDLNSQSIDQFSTFSNNFNLVNIKDSNHLIKELNSNRNELIVTTIQKLGHAIKKINETDSYGNRVRKDLLIKDERIVMIFDECHRSQAGENHKLIRKYFSKLQMIGFTGTPIFEENNSNIFTTKDLFKEQLHRYTIQEAINDHSVLPFQVEYINTFSAKGELDKPEVFDGKTTGEIYTKEVWESDQRLEQITRHIFAIHDQKTHKRNYNALFTINSISNLLRYYEMFKKINDTKEKSQQLRIGAIFSKSYYDGDMEKGDIVSNDALETIINDFNKMFKMNINHQD